MDCLQIFLNVWIHHYDWIIYDTFIWSFVLFIKFWDCCRVTKAVIYTIRTTTENPRRAFTVCSTRLDMLFGNFEKRKQKKKSYSHLQCYPGRDGNQVEVRVIAFILEASI